MAARAVLFLACLTSAAAAQEGFDAVRAKILAAKRRVFPSLVHIVNVEEVFARGRRQRNVSSGSGFFVDEKGHIVTNYHVAGGAERLYVTLSDRTKLRAEFVAGDAYTDLALLKVDPKEAWPRGEPAVAAFGDSDAVEIGDFVLAMGSPLSLSRTVSFGIVSARDRVLPELSIEGHATGKYNVWLQTDAAINPGNSGGPLVSMDGLVVGVNTRGGIGVNNIGFAIPSNVVREVVARLLETGAVERAYLGLTLQPLEEFENTAFGQEAEGVLVSAVAPASPSARAGMRPGDLLVRVDGAPANARFTEDLPGLYRRLAALPLDRPVELVVRRGVEERTLSVQAESLGRGLGREAEIESWGATVRGITRAMAQEIGLASTAGVLVTGVRAGSPASNRLDAGDVIVEVDGHTVEGLEDFLKVVEGAGDLVRIVKRVGTIRDVTVIRIPEEEE